jgi:hypothetical protein
MKVVRDLIYTQYGGSGFSGLSYESVLNMEFGEIVWWYEQLIELREAEAEALKAK